MFFSTRYSFVYEVSRQHTPVCAPLVESST